MVEFSEHIVGKYYKIIIIDNSSVDGKCVSYIPDKDNFPEIDSIWIKNENKTIEIYPNEVENLRRICADIDR